MSRVESDFARELERGIVEFNAGRFFEAHEVWEACWAEEIGEEKRFLQGLIQASAGYHKAEIGVGGGARKLMESSLRILEGFPADAYGVELESFRSRIRADLATDRRIPFPPTLRRGSI